MNSEASKLPEPGRRPAKRIYFAGLTLALALAGVSMKLASTAEAERPSMTEVPMLSLERRDGAMYRRGAAKPFTGLMAERYPLGALRSRTVLSNGLVHGLSEGFFANGSPQIVETFKNGISEGTRTVWHANGQMMSEGTLANGKQEGLFRRWHENGVMEIEAWFADGKPDGLSKSWHSNGQLKAEATMRAGEVVERKFYKDDGSERPVIAANTQTP